MHARTHKRTYAHARSTPASFPPTPHPQTREPLRATPGLTRTGSGSRGRSRACVRRPEVHSPPVAFACSIATWPAASGALQHAVLSCTPGCGPGRVPGCGLGRVPSCMPGWRGGSAGITSATENGWGVRDRDGSVTYSVSPPRSATPCGWRVCVHVCVCVCVCVCACDQGPHSPLQGTGVGHLPLGAPFHGRRLPCVCKSAPVRQCAVYYLVNARAFSAQRLFWPAMRGRRCLARLHPAQ